MEPGHQEEASSNIPHMHLFMSLKRRFPTLKDADITDSIQRFGLDEARCEVELTRKSQEQHKSCYSSWNRNRSKSQTSSTTLSSRSPSLSESPYSQVASPIHNGTSSPTPFPCKLTLSMSRELSTTDSSSNFVEPFPTVSPNSGAPIQSLQGLTPTAGVRSVYPDVLGSEITFAVQASNGFSTKVKNEPFSAPVIPDSREPAFDPVPPHRRSSADTVAEHHRKHTYPSPHPPRVFSSPSPPTSPPISSLTSTRSTYDNSPTTDTRVGTTPQPSNPSSPATVQEQMARKERLREEVDRRMEDKIKLKTEIESLKDELETKKRSQKLGVIRSKQEMELIQQDNSRLQFVCDELERMILESGESPKTDQDGRRSNGPVSPTFQDNPRIPMQPLLQNTGPNVSLSSGGSVAPTASMTPCRRAPSPPISTGIGITPQTSIPSGKPAGTEDGDKGWSCSKCTFLNSSYLNECEICSFPHFLGTPHISLQSGGSLVPANGGSACYCHHRHHYNLSHARSSAGELQDIHIQVRHQNLHSPSKGFEPLLNNWGS